MLMATCEQSRDSQLSSGVGKPLIINDLDCDVEPLSMDDFEDHHGQEVRLFGIHQARLAEICTSCLGVLNFHPC